MHNAHVPKHKSDGKVPPGAVKYVMVGYTTDGYRQVSHMPRLTLRSEKLDKVESGHETT